MKKTQTVFIVLTCGFWGRGATLQTAAMRCQSSGAKLSQPAVGYVIIADEKDCNPEIPLAEECACDSCGCIHFPVYAASVCLFTPADSSITLRDLLG